MKKALIGYTGFVGSNLLEQLSFTDVYNSSNIEDIRGKTYDIVYCAGVSAKKWLANQQPAQDWAAIQSLISNLEQVEARHFVLISTVDVYPDPVEVNEDSPISAEAHHAYGLNRLKLEQYIQDRFEHTIIRLPGLFGNGLKKNVIYDFMHDNCLDMIHQGGTFQFYNLAHLAADIQRTMDRQVKLINFATEPVQVKELAEQVFENGFTNNKPAPAPFYNFKSKHAALWGKEDYLYSKAEVLADIRQFVSTFKTHQ
jgi:nucleoside-diphosphate-sugar epimerase